MRHARHPASIQHLWKQPGAASPWALEGERAHKLGLAVIAGGPCLLVVLRYASDPDGAGIS